jgi:adhesin transport system outer membrane protein
MNTKSLQKTIFKGLVVSSLVCSSYSLMAQSLNDMVQHTLNTNPEVLEDVNLKLAAQQQVEQAKAGYYPIADLNLGIGRERSHSSSTNFKTESLTRKELGLTASQMIYDGFSTKHSVDSAESFAQAATHKIADTSERIGFSAVQSYLNVLRNDELISVSDDNLLAHEKVADQIGLRTQSGVGRKSDSDQAIARVSLAQSNFYAAQGNHVDAKTSFLRVIGLQPAELEAQEGCCDKVPSTLQEALVIAMEKHPSLQEAVANYEAAMAQTGIAESAFRPKVHFELEANSDDDTDGRRGSDKELLAMFRLRHNLANGGYDSARIAETEHLTEQQKQLVLKTQREVEADVRLAWNALKRANSRLPHLKTHAESAAKTHEAYQQQFNLGQRTLLDLLDQENERFTAKTDYIHGFYDEKIACYRVLASMGVLVETMGLTPVDDSVVVTSAEQVQTDTAE